MTKKYKLKKLVFVLAFLTFCLGIFILPIIFRNKATFLVIIDIVAIIVTLFYVFPYLLSKCLIIEDHAIYDIEEYYGFEIKKELRWDEIGYIVDDYTEPILFSSRPKIHIFHLMPKDSIRKPFKRISLSPGVTNYKDLLSEVLSRVGPDTEIDPYVKEVVEKYKNRNKQNVMRN